MVDAMPGCAWGWLRPSRAAASRAAQAGGLGKRESAEPAPRLSHQPGVRRCGINHLAAREHTLALGARADERHRDVELALDELNVTAGPIGQVVPQRLAPALERLEHGLAVVEVGLVRREMRRFLSVREQVAHADRDLLERGKHVELRQRERREAVESHRVTQSDEIEPTATALAARHRPELTAELAQPFLQR